MKLIGFDTSTDDTVVAATDAGEVIFDLRIGPGEGGRPVHSEALLAAVNQAASACGGWSEVERIAVGTGPGTFTGIRIGLSTANGLSLSTGIDLAAVSTLEGLSMPIRNGRPALAVLDARRGEVYAALFGVDGDALWDAFAASPEDLADRVAGLDVAPLVAGPGAVRFRDLLTRAGLDIPAAEDGIHRLSGRSICDLGALATRAGTQNPLEPTYLRVPDAQLWLERDSDKSIP